MLYDNYENEAEFRSKFIRPLLTKLGFLAVAELDGPQEYGKDFVFSEMTPFGFFRHYAVVAKHEKSIKQPGRVCETVLSQIKQAFSVGFRLPESTKESHVSCVLVMNSGKISNNADHWLRSELERERYGENTYIFNSERLQQLDNHVAFNRQDTLIPKLLGMKSTIELNSIVLVSIKNNLPKFCEARGFLTQALEGFITLPYLSDYISKNDVALILQEYRIIDAINTRYILGVSRTNSELKKQEVQKIDKLIDKAMVRSVLILRSLDECLLKFKPVAELC